MLIVKIYANRPLLKIMLAVLGFIVIEKDDSAIQRSRVLVSNNLSLFDHIALHLATGMLTVCIMKS